MDWMLKVTDTPASQQAFADASAMALPDFPRTYEDFLTTPMPSGMLAVWNGGTYPTYTL